MQHFSRPARQWARVLLQHSDCSSTVSAVVAPAVLSVDLKSCLSELSIGRRSGIFRARGICTSSFSLRAVGKGPGAGNDDREKDAEDEDADEKPRRKRGKQLAEVNPEDIAPEPMDYIFAGVPPDFKAPRLSDESKEKMWKTYSESPGPDMIDKLAEAYKIRKQRVHAILWLKDIEKKEAAERGKPLADDIEKAFEQIHGAYDRADDERHSILPSTKPDFTVQPEGWEGSVKARDQSMDEASAKEEKMMVEEFVQRMNFNKMQMAGLIKTDRLNRRRPEGGWSYLVEELGDEGKRGRRGGKRFVAQSDGTHRGLNELEKVFLKRETVRPRRRLVPK